MVQENPARVPKDPFYGFGEPGCAVVEAIAEQIGAQDRPECSATADVPVWDFTLIEPDWDKPGLIRGPETYLLDRQYQFLILIALRQRRRRKERPARQQGARWGRRREASPR